MLAMRYEHSVLINEDIIFDRNMSKTPLCYLVGRGLFDIWVLRLFTIYSTIYFIVAGIHFSQTEKYEISLASHNIICSLVFSYVKDKCYINAFVNNKLATLYEHSVYIIDFFLYKCNIL